jgi:hypothetical protein
MKKVGLSKHTPTIGTKNLCLFLLALSHLLLCATPPGDPICGIPSSLERVLAIRAERASALPTRQGALRAFAADPRLTLEKSAFGDPLHLLLEAPAGDTFTLESTPDLASPNWTPSLSALFPDQPLLWTDQSSASAPFGFFRLRSESPDTIYEPASNFRLLDAQGVTHDLFYHTHRTAIVVLASGTNLDLIAPFTSTLAELQRLYTNSIETWIVLSDPAPVRSNILAQAKTLGITFPVLLDQNDLAASSVGLTHAGEVALVQTADFTIPYRGEVVGPGAPLPADSLLGKALAGVINSLPITFFRTRTPGLQLSYITEQVPDYAHDIAPIFYQFCAKCHSPSGVAPFAMTNYSVIQDWASTIKHALLSRKMPPWHADPEYGHFTNDLSLPGNLKSAIVHWINAGAPRGDGGDPLAELPPATAFEKWPEDLGQPDALVTIPIQSIKATGSEPYRYVFVQSPNTTNVWLKAAVIRPSNYRSVHHYLVWKGAIGNKGVDGNSSYESHIAEFVPGYEPFRLPSDAGISLTRSNWLTFNLHYTPNGVATNDQPTLALWYHKTAPVKIWEPAGPANNTFAIPAQARDYAVQVEWTASTPITIYRFNPHMHLRGKRVKYELVSTNGKRELLLSVPDYDFNWQIGYALAQPKAVPTGARIVVSGAFDNSPQNLANPDPSVTVHWGDQSWMEMFVGFFDYTR